MQPLISVIVPVYNISSYLNECVNSLLAQTYSNIEIILVDDGSTDCSGKMCDEWEKKDERIKVLHKENGGLSDARNEGIKIASGELIGYVDGDDVIDPDMYEELYHGLITQSADMAVCKHLEFSDKIPDNRKKGNTKTYTKSEFMRMYAYQEDGITSAVWQRLYKKSLVSGLEFPKGHNYEDVVWSAQVIQQCKKIVLLDSSLYFYRVRTGSICLEQDIEKKTRGKINDLLLAYRSEAEFLQKSGYENEATWIWKKYFSEAIKICFWIKEYNLESLEKEAERLKAEIRKTKISYWKIYAFKIWPGGYYFLWHLGKKGAKK